MSNQFQYEDWGIEFSPWLPPVYPPFCKVDELLLQIWEENKGDVWRAGIIADVEHKLTRKSGYRPCRTVEEARPFLGQVLEMSKLFGDDQAKVKSVSMCEGSLLRPGADVVFDICGDDEVGTSVFLRWHTLTGGFVGVKI